MSTHEIVPDPVYDASRPIGAIKPVYQYPLLNSPGYTILGLLVTFPPNAATPPHRHGGASVVGHILSGTALNKMNDEPTYVLKAGDTWYEAPGCYHRVSENTSKTEPMVLLATFVIETEVLEREGPGVLVQIDEEWREGFEAKRKAAMEGAGHL